MPVTLTLGQLANQVRVSTTPSITDVLPFYATILIDLLAAATALVEARAPEAPTDSQNYAVVRICAYWFQGPEDAPARFGFNAWQNSGAAQILAPFIDRRAEAV